ncbi:MAG TPA: CotH kinase family protein, partial [Candidatus Eisenbacteria bacterium]|nr:CotH kinase family protein [Candidatus Eisenbacteria bacterium]
MGNFYAAATMLKWASLLWLMAGMLSPAAAAAPGSKNKESKKGSGKIEENIFTSRTVRTIRIEIPKESIANLRNYQWGNGNRVVARATVTEGDNVYTNVALHLKGAAGSFRSIDENPALTLHFDKFVPGQLFHRLEKISLNNSVQDPSYLTEKICREMFVAAGVPAPRADHAVVVLNGRDLGLYVMVEGINKQFLAHYFKNTKGNLNDGGFLKDITEELEKISGENPKDQSDLRILIAAASEPDPAKRLSDLEKVLELDRFISFI